MIPRPVLVGLPYDASSSFLRGSAEAPPHIREALRSPAGNAWSESGIEAVSDDVLEDVGDLDLPATADARTVVAAAIRDLAEQGRRFIALGGDHSVTYSILRGLHAAGLAPTLVQVDAHPDLYDEFEGDRFSHACPFARVMEERLVARLVQVGIRAGTGHQREQAKRFGVEQIDMPAWTNGLRPSVDGDVYVSIDLDGIDPAFAPGVSHREPGGLSVRDVITMLHGLGGRLIAADVVEFNPGRDPSGVTAAVAAKLVKELAGRLIAEAGTPS
jgi:agmatinase